MTLRRVLYLAAGPAGLLGAATALAGVGGWSRGHLPTSVSLEPPVAVLAADPRHPQIVYASTGGDGYGIFKSTDGGRHFRVLIRDAPDGPVVAVDPGNPETVYLGYCPNGL